MPLYAYKCESCGFAKDALQKMSDAPLTVCPNCGKDTFRKQVTAAGFQLKGSGWYVTDFRGGNGATGAPAVAKPESGEGAPAAPAASGTAPAPSPAGGAAGPAPAAAAAPAPAAPPARKD